MKPKTLWNNLTALFTVLLVATLCLGAVPVLAFEDGLGLAEAADEEAPDWDSQVLEEPSQDFVSEDFVSFEAEPYALIPAEGLVAEEAQEDSGEEFFSDRLVGLTEGGFSYTTYGSYATITGYDVSAGGASVVIPRVFGEYLITMIDSGAFNNANITSLSFAPDSVLEYIGSDAFRNTDLTTLSLPSSLQYIGTNAFYNCGLKSIDFGSGSMSIDYEAFARNQLSSVTIPAGVQLFGDGIFEDNSTLQSVTFEGSDVAIPRKTFKNCDIRSTKVGDHVVSIGEEAFAGNKNLTTIEIPASVTTIREGAFKDCTSATSVTGGDSLVRLSSTAFDGTPWLEAQPDGMVYVSHVLFMYKGTTPGYDPLEIPEIITGISDRAFRGQTWLTNVTFKESLKYIGAEAFSGTGLTSANVYASTHVDSTAFDFSPTVVPSSSSSDFVIDHNVSTGVAVRYVGSSSEVSVPATISDGFFTYSVLAIAEDAFQSVRETLKSVVIPSSVLYIEEEAFAGTSLSSITIEGEGLITVGKRAFANTKLSSITLPASLLTIEEEAFRGCNLTSVTLKGVQSILDYAFADNVSLKEIQIPDSLSTFGLGSGAFKNCTSLKKATFASGVYLPTECFMNCALESADFDGHVLNYGDYSLAGNTALKSLHLADSVSYVGTGAFSGCTSLAQISGGDGLTDIYANAFENTAWVTNHPDGPLYVGHVLYKYKGTYPLAVGVIPPGTTVICPEAFRGQKVVESVTIPASVEKIMEGAFRDCDNLKLVTVPYSTYQIDDYALGYYKDEFKEKVPGFVIQGEKYSTADYYASINGFTFKEMPSNPYSTLLLPDGSLSIIGYSGSETKLTIPDKIMDTPVTAIEDSAFASSPITQITLPDSITSIGKDAFNGSSLSSVTFGKGLKSIGENAFAYTSLDSVTIPAGVTEIGEGAFSNCNSLRKATFLGSAKISANLFYNCDLSQFPEGPVTSVGESALSGNPNLKNLVIPETVSELGDYAFMNCSSLKSVSGGEGLIKVGEDAFDGTPFMDSLGDGAFYVGSVLVSYKGSVPSGTAFAVQEGTLAIQAKAFYGQVGLASLTLPDSLLYIGESAFEGCTSLKSVSVPSAVKSIGNYAFGFEKGFAGVKVAGFVLSGASESVAEKYAAANGLTFEATAPPVPVREAFVPAVGDASAGYLVTGAEQPIVVEVGKVYTFTITGASALSQYDEADLVEGDGLWSLAWYVPAIMTQKFDEVDKDSMALTRDIHYVSSFALPTYMDLPINLFFRLFTWDGSKWVSSDTLESTTVVLSLKAPTVTVTPTPTPAPEGSLSLNLKKKTLYTAGSSKYTEFTLVPTLENLEGTVSFKSSKTSVATVDSNGLVKAVAKGSAKITASIKVGEKTYKKTCKVTVKKPSVKVSETKVTLKVGETFTVTAKATPTATIKWSSKNKKIAKVKDGVITAKKKGTTYIYAKANGLKKKIKVTVKKK